MWRVLVNPHAGHRGSDTVERTKRALAAQGVDAELRVPETPIEMRAAVTEAIADECTHLAVVGGDGSFNLVVDELIRAEADPGPVLALLPTGAGSDFARMFALPQSIEKAVAHLHHATDY